ncbi:hypothetical protein OG196_44055 (plasmid) [Kitasatospora purpeofusca]|uniref:hypothetical protein n=1 Tax=Kitasatospora purpeofusca TaxID=67352 RepID=UPI002E0D7891|nr:hypothetical protein OG196_44055 [Kitasatospora purpeofusca]
MNLTELTDLVCREIGDDKALRIMPAVMEYSTGLVRARTAADQDTTTAAALRQAAQDTEAEAQARLRAAEAERLAIAAEDEARLTPKDRATRKVARMILAATPDGHTPDPKAIDLKAVMDALAVSQTTASDYRTEAAALLAGGYRPTA